MGKKCTNIEKQERLKVVHQMLCEMKTRSQICRHARDCWGLSDDQADRYIREAREILASDWALDRKELSAQMLSAYTWILDEANRTKQLSNALGALAGLSRLTRLDPSLDKS